MFFFSFCLFDYPNLIIYLWPVQTMGMTGKHHLNIDRKCEREILYHRCVTGGKGIVQFALWDVQLMQQDFHLVLLFS